MAKEKPKTVLEAEVQVKYRNAGKVGADALLTPNEGAGERPTASACASCKLPIESRSILFGKWCLMIFEMKVRSQAAMAWEKAKTLYKSGISSFNGYYKWDVINDNAKRCLYS